MAMASAGGADMQQYDDLAEMCVTTQNRGGGH